MMRRVGRTQARIAQMLLTLVFVMIPFANKPAQAEVKPLTVTINGGESLGVTPVSTAVPEALSVNVEGEPETPPDVPNAGPTYTWTLVEAKYRAAANGQWENVSPAHGSVTLTPDGLPTEAESIPPKPISRSRVFTDLRSKSRWTGALAPARIPGLAKMKS